MAGMFGQVEGVWSEAERTTPPPWGGWRSYHFPANPPKTPLLPTPWPFFDDPKSGRFPPVSAFFPPVSALVSDMLFFAVLQMGSMGSSISSNLPPPWPRVGAWKRGQL